MAQTLGSDCWYFGVLLLAPVLALHSVLRRKHENAPRRSRSLSLRGSESPMFQRPTETSHLLHPLPAV